MREILGRRRAGRSPSAQAALRCATRWHWPIVPGIGLCRPEAVDPVADAVGTVSATVRSDAESSCACGRGDCMVPGAHPHDPSLLAATTDPRMVTWWWANRPEAPVLLATGGQVSAVSLPAEPGRRALRQLDRLGVRIGPVLATENRMALLVQPYSLEQLGELLADFDWVPGSVCFHGESGYVALPPTRTVMGEVRWVRQPRGQQAPWLPSAGALMEILVDAGQAGPQGSRLAY